MMVDFQDLEGLTPAHFADACQQQGIDPRLAPQGLGPMVTGVHVTGRVLPVRHSGSVDIFIEVISQAEPGSVLVIDDNGRRDQACIGDLVAGEAKLAGLAGILVWGCHRDTQEIRALGLPVFSFGAFPSGPRTASERDPDALTSARVGDVVVDAGHVVVADDDGAIFLPADKVREIGRPRGRFVNASISRRNFSRRATLSFSSSASPSTSTNTPPIPRTRCVSTCKRSAGRSRRDGCDGS